MQRLRKSLSRTFGFEAPHPSGPEPTTNNSIVEEPLPRQTAGGDSTWSPGDKRPASSQDATVVHLSQVRVGEKTTPPAQISSSGEDEWMPDSLPREVETAPAHPQREAAGHKKGSRRKKKRKGDVEEEEEAHDDGKAGNSNGTGYQPFAVEIVRGVEEEMASPSAPPTAPSQSRPVGTQLEARHPSSSCLVASIASQASFEERVPTPVGPATVTSVSPRQPTEAATMRSSSNCLPASAVERALTSYGVVVTAGKQPEPPTSQPAKSVLSILGLAAEHEDSPQGDDDVRIVNGPKSKEWKRSKSTRGEDEAANGSGSGPTPRQRTTTPEPQNPASSTLRQAEPEPPVPPPRPSQTPPQPPPRSGRRRRVTEVKVNKREQAIAMAANAEWHLAERERAKQEFIIAERCDSYARYDSSRYHDSSAEDTAWSPTLQAFACSASVPSAHASVLRTLEASAAQASPRMVSSSPADSPCLSAASGVLLPPSPRLDPRPPARPSNVNPVFKAQFAFLAAAEEQLVDDLEDEIEVESRKEQIARYEARVRAKTMPWPGAMPDSPPTVYTSPESGAARQVPPDYLPQSMRKRSSFRPRAAMAADRASRSDGDTGWWTSAYNTVAGLGAWVGIGGGESEPAESPRTTRWPEQQRDAAEQRRGREPPRGTRALGTAIQLRLQARQAEARAATLRQYDQQGDWRRDVAARAAAASDKGTPGAAYLTHSHLANRTYSPMSARHRASEPATQQPEDQGAAGTFQAPPSTPPRVPPPQRLPGSMPKSGFVAATPPQTPKAHSTEGDESGWWLSALTEMSEGISSSTANMVDGLVSGASEGMGLSGADAEASTTRDEAQAPASASPTGNTPLPADFGF